MKKYFSFLRIRFVNSLQYRAAAFGGIITQFTWGFLEIFAFNAFYRANPAAFPMALSDTVSYIWLQQAFLALFMVWFFENEIFDAITGGGIAYQLVRPIDLYGRWFTQSVANRLSRASLRCLPILLVAFFLPEGYRLSPPPNLLQGLLFLLSSALALCVVVGFNMLIYVLTFYTMSPLGLRIIAAIFADFLAGATIPLPFFPAWMQEILSLLPFASMQNMPLRIYSGNISGTEAARGISLQLFWIFFLSLLGRLLMRRALRRIIVQGG